MPESQSRLAAALADRYRITRELGAGGMATVYLAEDLKHDRKVAIKVLKPELAAVLGAERFVQEIKTTAALSHPHILPLFDSGEAGGFLYYVMPYIEGETIRDRLNRETQLGIAEAVRITSEIADALDYAHRHGVIHRDIKPENILLHDGRPMVMDFGIALAVSAAAGGRMTETGLSLGTPHYMSPEQATADKDITARSDIYSLASVLYEMLTGNPPHTGSSAQQIIMKIITESVPPVTTLRRNVPPNVAAALGTALEKLPADRFSAAHDFAAALGNTAYATATTSALAAARTNDPRARRLTLTLAAALAVVSSLSLWLAFGRQGAAAMPSRFAIALPTASSLRTTFGSSMAVSADGGVLIFAGADSAGEQRLWVKRAGEVDAAPIAGTEEGFSPFLSPDGTELGFFRGAVPSLYVVALGGGSPRMVTGPPMGSSGGSWATDGFIYFDSNQSGIDRVRPDGSNRESVVTLDSARQEAGYAWPEVLPGNKVLVARLRYGADAQEGYQIVAVPIGGGAPVTLTRGVLARHHDGNLLVVRADGVLVAYRLVDGGFGLDSTAVILATDARVVRENFGAAELATDRRGALYYVNGVSASGVGQTPGTGNGLRFEWLESGGRRSLADSARPLDGPLVGTLSAPGLRRVLVGVAGDSGRLWVRELPAGTLLPIALPLSRFQGLGWDPTGESLFVSIRVGRGTEFWRVRRDGLGAPAVVARDSGAIGGLIAVSPDRRWFIAQRLGAPGASNGLVALDRRTDTTFRDLFPGDRVELKPRLSPDGRWLAYASARSGAAQVYVQPFPDLDRDIRQVSVDGGDDPHWSPRGDRLYFLRRSGLDAILSVDIGASITLTAGPPRVVLRQPDLEGLRLDWGWDVGARDDEFLVIRQVARYRRPQLVRVENLGAELARIRR